MPVGRGSVLESQTAHPLSDGEMTRAVLLPLNPAYSHSPWFSPPGESNVLFSHQINEGKSNEENNMEVDEPLLDTVSIFHFCICTLH